jgi:anaerobic magnesium-protoporphyrin IX monomethyl ester cyclase
MKVIFLSPYSDIYSLGLRSLSSFLRSRGYDIRLIFLPLPSVPFYTKYDTPVVSQVVELAKDADLIGISVMSNYIDKAVQLTRALKGNCKAPVLWGGMHPTVRPEESLEFTDLVCMGEGEEALLELLQCMSSGGDCRKIRNIWGKNGETIWKNEVRPLIKDLDILPAPDYDVGNHFILYQDEIRPLDKELYHRHLMGSYVTMATRGCLFSCAYCCHPALRALNPDYKGLRCRSAQRVVEELVDAKSRFDFVDRITLVDDMFVGLPHDYIAEFSREYKQKVNLPLKAAVSPTTVTEESLKSLAEAGLYAVRIGVQSASRATLKLYRRNISTKKMLEAAQSLNSFQGSITTVSYDFILDNPWELEEDIVQSLEFLLQLPKPYQLRLYSLTFYPGTPLYDKARESGIIKDDWADIYRKNFRSYRKTYLNLLFVIFSNYNLPDKLARFLINRRLLRSRLHLLFYPAIWFLAEIQERGWGPPRLLRLGLRALFAGDFMRIASYLKRRVRTAIRPVETA